MKKNFEQIRQALKLFTPNDLNTYKLVEQAAYNEAEKEGTVDLQRLMASCFSNFLGKETHIFLDEEDVWDLYPEEWFEAFANDFEIEFQEMVKERIEWLKEGEW